MAGAAPKRGFGVEAPLGVGVAPNNGVAVLPSAAFGAFVSEVMLAGFAGVAPNSDFAGCSAVDEGAAVAPKLNPTDGAAAVCAGLVDVPNNVLADVVAGFSSPGLAAFPNRLLDWKTEAGFGVSSPDAFGAAPNTEDVDFGGSSEVAGFAPNSGLGAGFGVSDSVVGGLAPNSVDAGVAFSGSEAGGFAPKIEAAAGFGVSFVAAGFVPKSEAAVAAAGAVAG